MNCAPTNAQQNIYNTALFHRTVPMQDFRNYAPAPDLLKDRVVLITGSSDGIGKALAFAAAKLGATVVLHGRSQKKLEKVDDELHVVTGKRGALLPLDFEKAGPAEYEALAQAVEKNFGRLDGLVHNAAMLGERAPIAHHDVPKWLRTLHVNTNAPFILTRYCLPLLQRSNDASIVFTSSTIVTKPQAYWGAYCVSKWANEGMMHMLADELENTPNIRVNSVNPGPVATALRLQAYPAEDRSKLQTPEAVVNPFLYLLGPDSRGVTNKRLE